MSRKKNKIFTSVDDAPYWNNHFAEFTTDIEELEDIDYDIAKDLTKYNLMKEFYN